MRRCCWSGKSGCGLLPAKSVWLPLAASQMLCLPHPRVGKIAPPTTAEFYLHCGEMWWGFSCFSSSQAPYPSFSPEGRKLAHSAAPPLPNKTAALGFAGGPMGRLPAALKIGQVPLKRRCWGQLPSPVPQEATHRLTGAKAEENCPRKFSFPFCETMVPYGANIYVRRR